MSWSMVSKAADKSSITKITSCCLPRAQSAGGLSIGVLVRGGAHQHCFAGPPATNKLKLLVNHCQYCSEHDVVLLLSLAVVDADTK